MKAIKKFFSDFKKFISKGSVIDMSVAVIIGTAFTAIVTTLTNKILMPLINWVLSFGGDGLSSAYTYLKIVYTLEGTIDLERSIYIDWGSLITSIINFFIIAFTIFVILKILMKTQGLLKTAIKETPTKAERKILKSNGVDMKNVQEVLSATAELREKNKPVEEPPKPTQEQLLSDILVELQKQNENLNPIKSNQENSDKITNNANNGKTTDSDN